MSTTATNSSLEYFIATFTHAKYLEILWSLIKDKEDPQNIIKNISLIEVDCVRADKGKKATINDLHLDVRTVDLTRAICNALGAYREKDFDDILSRFNTLSAKLQRRRT